MYNGKIIEIEGSNELVSLPIVKFPPFKLRAQLVEKDPVVWLHLIETYVQYCQYLMNIKAPMIERVDDSTLDHLRIFIRSYIHEMAQEEGKLVSLGVNSDVTEQLNVLKRWIFYMVKSCGLLHLQIFGETLWDLITLYVNSQPLTVQSLITGSTKPTINVQKAQINRIPQLQQYLKQVVESNKFDRIGLKTFQRLLTCDEMRNNNRKNNKNSRKNIIGNKFADDFLTLYWVECLESWWSKGSGRFENLARQLCVTTLLSVSEEKLISFIKEELQIDNIDSLLYFPLFGSIIISTNFIQKRSKLSQSLPFLFINYESSSSSLFEDNINQENNDDDDDYDTNIPKELEIKIDANDIKALQEFFPNVTEEQAIYLLKQYDNNTEIITNELLENPSVLDTIEMEIANSKKLEAKEKEYTTDRERAKVQDSMKLLNPRGNGESKKNDILKKHVPDEIRNKTLTRALKLLYQDDDDERDDTYDEAAAESNRIGTSLKTLGLNDGDNEKEHAGDDVEAANKEAMAREEKREAYLWDLLKQDQTLFARNRRGSSVRKNMKKDTSWSDEQIEGWARMLEKSPQRAKLLEEKYMFKGNVRTGKTSWTKSKNDSSNNSSGGGGDGAEQERRRPSHIHEASSSSARGGKKANGKPSQQRRKRTAKEPADGDKKDGKGQDSGTATESSPTPSGNKGRGKSKQPPKKGKKPSGK